MPVVTRKSKKRPKTERRAVEVHGTRPIRDVPMNPNNDVPMHHFLKEVDADAFLSALQTADDPKFNALADAIADPAQARASLPTLLRKHGVGLTDLVGLYRNHQHLVAAVHRLNELPKVVQHVAEDAQRRPVYCDRCDGQGKVPNGTDAEGKARSRKCPKCQGTKTIEAPASEHARDLIHKSEGLIKDGGGVNIMQNFGMGASLEDTLSNVGRLLDEPPSKDDVLDAEPADEGE